METRLWRAPKPIGNECLKPHPEIIATVTQALGAPEGKTKLCSEIYVERDGTLDDGGLENYVKTYRQAALTAIQLLKEVWPMHKIKIRSWINHTHSITVFYQFEESYSVIKGIEEHLAKVDELIAQIPIIVSRKRSIIHRERDDLWQAVKKARESIGFIKEIQELSSRREGSL